MKYDFENDLKLELQSNISKFGIKIPMKDCSEMLLDFLTIHKKLIYQKPRAVFINPELEKKLNSHPKKKEVLLIKEMFIRGSNLNVFQSKKLYQTKFHDHLAYEWDIHHFHLSSKIDKGKKFVKQINQLLFAYVDNDRVIFLDIENHTPGIFGDEKWIEILHNHFPDAIEQYKTKGITDFHPKLNGIEKQTIWDKGYSMGMTKVNDTIYFSKGIGRMTSGHSAIVALQTNNILRWLKEISTNIENHITYICENFQIDKDNAHFKLRLGNQTFEIIEIVSKQLIIKFPESFIIK